MNKLFCPAAFGLLLNVTVFAALPKADLPVNEMSIAALPTVADSVGVEKRDGKRFIIHQVNQGQTLYSIARRYNTSVALIRAANPDLGEAVRYKQVVRVPLSEASQSRKERRAEDKAIRQEEKAKERSADVAQPTAGKPQSATPTATAKVSGKARKPADISSSSGIHVVEPGQTLYSLAVRYGVSQVNMRKWNNLSSDNVLIGQALIVSEKAFLARQPARPAPKPEPKKPVAPAVTAEKPAPKPEPEVVKEVAKHEPATTPERDHTATPVTTPPLTETPVSGVPVTGLPVSEPKVIRAGDSAPLPTKGRRISDVGIAETIDSHDNSNKFLALHRSAPVGTLVQVRNDSNNQSIWVKVIGRLPNTGVNDKILIKLSARAFEKLSPVDRRFRAEVSYIAP